uniref:Uncharacterized protein n=1 Tax=Cumathamnion serrulatum TaxID=1206573 RepID=A0A7U1G3S6_9FLOR|nr:hypothetical protein K4Y23_pgp190 [Cumathamnion serrulatum]QQY85264.1 hypothetical protein [Cumathamnion serrulatum]
MTLMQAMFESYYQYLNNEKTLIFISKPNKNLYASFSKPLNLNQYVESKFISRSLWNEFINRYWQETVFISTTNILSENYINRLKTNGLSIYKDNDYKHFLLNFSKDLINGKIHVSLNENINIEDKSIPLIIHKNNKSIKYIWRKGINWHISCLYFKYLSVKNKYIKKIPLVDFSYLNVNSLPLFTVSNQNNKLIMAESANQILIQRNLFQVLYNWYNIFSLKKIYLEKLYTGLLFINPKDALEYKDYIAYKYLQFSQNNSLKFFIGQFNLYYKLLYSSARSREFRLVPDLKEISNFVYKYQYYKNIKLDKQQEYGKHHFQGQPIYIIEPLLIKNKNTNKQEQFNYFYPFKSNNKIINYKAIFLNYETALMAWNKLKVEYSSYKLPKKPSIYVSNLENFIKIYNQTNENFHFIFIPSPETYNFIKSQKQFQDKNYLKHMLIDKSLYIKSLCKRFIWSLTSRQPINW